MYLLIQSDIDDCVRDVIYLHSTMYLLIPVNAVLAPAPFIDLHSTMYLLIRVTEPSRFLHIPIFTFHYVSINSK